MALSGREKEEGQVLIWLLILLPLLLLLVAMLIEGGLMFRTYRLAQMAADAGAHAAAQEMDVAVYQAHGRVILSPQAAEVAQRYAVINARGPIACAQPQVWAGRVRLRCSATLQPQFISGVPEIRVVVLGNARPAWGATRERE